MKNEVRVEATPVWNSPKGKPNTVTVTLTREQLKGALKEMNQTEESQFKPGTIVRAKTSGVRYVVASHSVSVHIGKAYSLGDSDPVTLISLENGESNTNKRSEVSRWFEEVKNG